MEVGARLASGKTVHVVGGEDQVGLAVADRSARALAVACLAERRDVIDVDGEAHRSWSDQ
jgi:NAD(P)-dependent dehydrogenase (short-subunit alcohol dehydrogenase family)